MLIHPMVERLRGLGLAAMADAFIECSATRPPMTCRAKIGLAC